jgi:hypothetical protein
MHLLGITAPNAGYKEIVAAIHSLNSAPLTYCIQAVDKVMLTFKGISLLVLLSLLVKGKFIAMLHCN